MASHKGWDRSLVVTSVLKDGRSLNLSRAKGQFGVVDMSSAPTKDGLKVVSSFEGLPKDNKFQLRLGKAPINVNRSQSDKAWASKTFKISDIVGLDVDAPKVDGIATDEFIIGYNGFDADSALSFNNGDNEELDIELYGKAMGILGYEKASVNFKIYFEAPNTGAFTNQEIVENAIETFKDITLIGGVPVTDYLEITPVNSESPATVTGTDFAFYNLVLEDDGDYTALAKVQSQYNDFKVERSDRSDTESTYTLITTPGATIADYEKFKASKIKGCDACPAGYTEFEDGFVYNVLLEDDGADQTAAVEAIAADVTAGSAVKVAQLDGVGSYTVVVADELTEAEIAAFIAANPTATVELSASDVSELCSPTALDTFSWVEGDSCTAIEETFTITLADDECGQNILAELQAAYPDLNITVDSSNACQTRYTTTVLSNIVCEECDAEFRDLFSAEAPEPYNLVEWEKAPKTYSATALMGIRIKAKEAILSGDEQFRDDLFFMATSTRVRVAGGYPTTVSESFNAGLNDRFAVKILSIGEEPENWGGDLREHEDISKRYFEGQGMSRHEGNNYGKFVLGEETNLDGTSPYVDYILTVQISSLAQSFSELKNETFYYHLYVQPGKHQDVEDVLNALASQAGVAPVQAYGKTAV